MQWTILLCLFGTVFCQYSGTDIPPEYVTCQRGSACVDLDQCGPDEYIITDGSSVINKRTGIGEKCDIFRQRCCKIPGYIPKPTEPECRLEYDCVPLNICGPDNTIITDGSGVINKRTQPKHPCTPAGFPGTRGICCLKPGFKKPPPEPLRECFVDEICLFPVDCEIPRFIDNRNKNPQECFVGGPKDVGVCCLKPYAPPPPPPPTPEPREPFPLESDKCGHRNKLDIARITKPPLDNDAFFGEFPWQAIIFNKNYTFQCGAVIISERYLLTAAHCVEHFGPHDISVRVGDYQVDKFDEPLQYVDRPVFAIHIHSDYNTRNNHNGIALLELKDPLVKQYHINSICLPSTPIDYYNPLHNFTSSARHQQCYVTGWGKDSFDGRYQARMKKLHLGILSHSHCQDLLRRHPKLNKWFQLHPGFLCAGGQLNRDACKGDGGGPLSCFNEASGRYEVVGLTSWGLGCGEHGVPGVYIDVFKYLDWIESVVSKASHFQPGSFGGYGK